MRLRSAGSARKRSSALFDAAREYSITVAVEMAPAQQANGPAAVAVGGSSTEDARSGGSAL
jgi:hypothetical protein